MSIAANWRGWLVTMGCNGARASGGGALAGGTGCTVAPPLMDVIVMPWPINHGVVPESCLLPDVLLLLLHGGQLGFLLSEMLG